MRTAIPLLIVYLNFVSSKVPRHGAAFAQPAGPGQAGVVAMQNALSLSVALADIGDARVIPALLGDVGSARAPVDRLLSKVVALHGATANLPDEVRTMTSRAAMIKLWVSAQVFRAANHIPTGTEHISLALLFLCAA